MELKNMETKISKRYLLNCTKNHHYGKNLTRSVMQRTCAYQGGVRNFSFSENVAHETK